jgi:large subunit ribosomal protein L28
MINLPLQFLKGRLAMAKCAICGKTSIFINKVSHSHRVTSKKQRANLQRVKAVVDGKKTRIWVCTKCLKAGKVQKAI